MKAIYLLTIMCLTSYFLASAQSVPGLDENIPHLVTFGADSDISWGDDNFCQIIFFKVPENHSLPIYLRVYDPDTGGDVDEQKDQWNTKVSFGIYGGKGSCSENDARDMVLDGNYDSGTLLLSRTFGEDERYDGSWYTFGPINPDEGEFLEEFGGHVFKVIVEGVSGDDGNLYNLYLSKHPDRNQDVEGASAFYYKYTFRMNDNVNEIAHIYPYIDKEVIAIKQTNFDWDNDGRIQIVSLTRPGNETMAIGGEEEWVTSTHKIFESEKTNSLDLQLVKNQSGTIRSNNVVIFLENQYGEKLKFYSIPIGEYKYESEIGIEGFHP